MALSRRSGGRGETNTWPGFVDAMTALLLILMFVLSIFMIVQFTMHQKLTGATRELDDLTRQLAGMANVLALEKDKSAALEAQVGELKSNIAGHQAEVDKLNAAMAAMIKARDTAQARVAELEGSLNQSISEREALAAALASARSEVDAAAEAARLAAAKREAMEALIAGLRQKEAEHDSVVADIEAERTRALALLAQLQEEKDAIEKAQAEKDAELAALEQEKAGTLALLAQLQADKEGWEQLQAELERQRQELEGRNLTLEEQRKEAEALRLAVLKQLEDAKTSLTAEEEAKLAEAAAAEALRQKLAESEAELDAMTLALEQARKEAEQTLILLAAAESAKRTLENQLEGGSSAAEREAALRKLAEEELSKAVQQTLEEQKRVALLNAQVKELREQLGGLQALLDDAERRDAVSQVQIAKLGERLNAALAQKVGQLARFRSVFFEKMDEVLGGRQDIQRVGDRFVFQSEVLFAAGSADLGLAGQGELTKLGRVLREVSKEMPEELNWVLRVDGHTDKIPVGRNARFRDNWELSQARALSVVRFLVEREGVVPNRLLAAGFGEFQPIDPGDTAEALAKNRRIEFKFTER